MAKVKYGDYGTGIPRHEIESLARCLLPAIRSFYESEEGKREFEIWKNQQRIKSVTRQTDIACRDRIKKAARAAKAAQ